MEEYNMSSLPLPTGRHKVGRTSFELIDHNRNEIYSANTDDERKFVIWAWYPATPDNNSTNVEYLPGRWSEADIVYNTSFGSSSLGCHSFSDAPIDSQSSYPIILLSPAGFSPLSYSSLTEDLASHGYIVVGINHTYDAPVTVLRDGTVMHASPKFMEGVNSRSIPRADSFHFRAEAVDYKVQDLKFTASAMRTLNNGQHVLAGHLNSSAFGTFGHSMGGNAALDFCRTDSLCKAAANLDGASWNDLGEIGMNAKPAMIIAAEHIEYTMPCAALVDAGAFPNVEWCEAERAVLWNGWKKIRDTANPFYGISIKGSKHVNFADVQFVPLPSNSPFRAVIGSVDPNLMCNIVRHYLLAFFDKHLKEIPETILDEPLRENRPEVSSIVL
jgi:hypothetical protein